MVLPYGGNFILWVATPEMSQWDRQMMDPHFYYDMEWYCAAWHFKSNMIFLISKQHWYDHGEMYRWRCRLKFSLKKERLAVRSCAMWMLCFHTGYSFMSLCKHLRMCVSFCRHTVSLPSIRSWDWVGVQKGQWAALGPAKYVNLQLHLYTFTYH